jgi:hypothetical protein
MFFGPSLTPYLILGGVITSLALSGYAYVKGRADANAYCRAAELQAEIDTLKRDMAAWKAADEIEAMLQADIDAERKSLEDKVVEYELELLSRPDDRCTLGPGDIERLRLDGGK